MVRPRIARHFLGMLIFFTESEILMIFAPWIEDPSTAFSGRTPIHLLRTSLVRMTIILTTVSIFDCHAVLAR